MSSPDKWPEGPAHSSSHRIMLRECRQSRFRAPPELAPGASDSRRNRQPERDRSPKRSSQPLQAANALRRPSSVERLINQRLQFSLNPPALRRRLHHQDHEHIVLGIDKEESAADAVTAIFTCRQPCIWQLRGSHCEAETIAAVGARKIEMVAGDFGFRPNM